MKRITIVSRVTGVKEIPVIMDTSHLVNGTVNMFTGILLNVNYSLVFTPNTGYDFYTLPICTIYDSYDNVIFTGTATKEGTTYKVDFNVTEDTQQITITCSGTAEPVTEVSLMFPFINVYKVTREEVQILENKRFIRVGQESASPFDLSNYVLALYRPFTPVEIGDKSKVFFGEYDMGISSPVVKNHNTLVEFEGIKIDETYKNAIDYDSTIVLYLPFIGMHELRTPVVMGKTVSLLYVIDNVTGDATCYIKSDGDLLDAISTTAKQETPYNQTFSENMNLNSSIRNNNFQYDLVPKILIDTPIPFSDKFNPYNDTDYYSTIQYEQGYIEGDIFTEDINNDDITVDEKNEIKQLFKNGVIV